MPESMYRQIADDLQRRIESGELGRGTQIPTEIDLRERYEASRNTIRDAVKWLTTRGLVEFRPGQGTFVVEKINPFVTTLTEDPATGRGGGEEGVYLAEVLAFHRTPENSEPWVELQKAEVSVARGLRIEEGTPVVSRHQQRFIDGIPWSLQTSLYPMSLVQQGAIDLIQAVNHHQAGPSPTLPRSAASNRSVTETRSPCARRTSTRPRSSSSPPMHPVPVFEIFRVGFDKDGQPLPADHHRVPVRPEPVLDRRRIGRIPGRPRR